MSTNKLAQVIRKIVREEVRKEVRQVLTEQSKPKKVTKKEFKSGLSHALGLTDSIERAERRPKNKKQYPTSQSPASLKMSLISHIPAPFRYRTGQHLRY